MGMFNRMTGAAIAVATAVATIGAVGGCASQSDPYGDAYYDEYYGDVPAGGTYYYDGSGYVVRDYYYDRPYYGGHGYYDGHGHYHGGGGGQRHHDHHGRERVRVPRSANEVAGGEGGLEYTAEQKGRVYVRDERTGKVIYRGRVDAGDEVKVAADAKGRRVSVDGKTVRGDLSAKPRDREVFFRPDHDASASARVEARQQRAAEQSAAREAAKTGRAEQRAERAEARESARSERSARSESKTSGGGSNRSGDGGGKDKD